MNDKGASWYVDLMLTCNKDIFSQYESPEYRFGTIELTLFIWVEYVLSEQIYKVVY